jgi:superfamily II DNA/RNA helicase
VRIIFWARGQVAIPLITVMRLSGIDPCALIGGMTPEDTSAMLKRFEADPNAIMVATAAFDHGWNLDVEAAQFELADSFCSMYSAAKRTKEPSFDAPTSKRFLDWYYRRNDYSEALEIADTKLLPAPKKARRKKKDQDYESIV